MTLQLVDVRLADVQDLVGKPYAHGARGPDAFDCWGLCVEVYRRRGFELPDYAVHDLTHEETTALILGHAADRADWIGKPDDWCFVFDRRNGHIGLHWRGQVLHCARMHGCIVQRLADFTLMHPRSVFARWRA